MAIFCCQLLLLSTLSCAVVHLFSLTTLHCIATTVRSSRSFLSATASCFLLFSRATLLCSSSLSLLMRRSGGSGACSVNNVEDLMCGALDSRCSRFCCVTRGAMRRNDVSTEPERDFGEFLAVHLSARFISPLHCCRGATCLAMACRSDVSAQRHRSP